MPDASTPVSPEAAPDPAPVPAPHPHAAMLKEMADDVEAALRKAREYLARHGL